MTGFLTKGSVKGTRGAHLNCPGYDPAEKCSGIASNSQVFRVGDTTCYFRKCGKRHGNPLRIDDITRWVGYALSGEKGKRYEQPLAVGSVPRQKRTNGSKR